MADLPDPSIHPLVPKEEVPTEDMPAAHAPTKHDIPAACEGSSKDEGLLDGADPFAAFTEWAGDIDAAAYADLSSTF